MGEAPKDWKHQIPRRTINKRTISSRRYNQGLWRNSAKMLHSPAALHNWSSKDSQNARSFSVLSFLHENLHCSYHLPPQLYARWRGGGGRPQRLLIFRSWTHRAWRAISGPERERAASHLEVLDFKLVLHIGWNFELSLWGRYVYSKGGTTAGRHWSVFHPVYLRFLIRTQLD